MPRLIDAPTESRSSSPSWSSGSRRAASTADEDNFASWGPASRSSPTTATSSPS